MRNEADALTSDDVDDEPAAGHTTDPAEAAPAASSGHAADDEWDDEDWDDGDEWDDDAVSPSPYPDSPAAASPYPDSPYPDAGSPHDGLVGGGLDDEYDDDEYDDYRAYDGPGRVPDPLFRGDPDEFEFDYAPSEADPRRAAQGDLLVFDEPPGVVPYRPRRMSRMERRRRVKLQARRVRRIIRHVEPWSVLKISLFFWACLWVIFLVAGFMIWGVAESSGTIGKLEDLITDLFALDTFEFDASQIFRGYALGGLALAIAGTTFNVLMCLLFNLISDLTGGLRITMIEEETARPAPPRRARRRRPPPRR